MDDYLKNNEWVSDVFEIAFGDDAINRDYSPEEVLNRLREMSDDALITEENRDNPMHKPHKKTYIWDSEYMADYTNGAIITTAYSLEEAIQNVINAFKKRRGYDENDIVELDVSLKLDLENDPTILYAGDVSFLHGGS